MKRQVSLGQEALFLHAPYTLYAPTSKSGFFGLSQLQEYCSSQMEPVKDLREQAFLLDFSHVAVWDIAAVLWLVVALQYYRREGLAFRVKLPEANSDCADPRAAASADYLRRWKVDRALSHIGDLSTVLLPEQAAYFEVEPDFYRPSDRQIRTPFGLERLLSGRLSEVRDLTRVNPATRRRQVSDEEVDDCISDFQDAGIAEILYNICDITKDDADCFAVHLVGEALLNMRQHPNATTGLLGVSVMGATKELVLAVVDNGEYIAETILPVFNSQLGESLEIDAASPKDRARVLEYATQKGVSCKIPASGEEVGQGLFYIKEDTVDRFGGKLRICSAGLLSVFSESAFAFPDYEEWPHSWPGNLLRIAVPLKSKER